jgi:hypothetical protein
LRRARVQLVELFGEGGNAQEGQPCGLGLALCSFRRPAGRTALWGPPCARPFGPTRRRASAAVFAHRIGPARRGRGRPARRLWHPLLIRPRPRRLHWLPKCVTLHRLSRHTVRIQEARPN